MSSYWSPQHGWITRSWQRPAKVPRTAKQIAAAKQFTQATQLVKHIPVTLQEWAMTATKDTVWTWKDFIISMMYGRALEVHTADGQVWKGIRIVSEEIQAALDTITTTPGAMLIRTATGWGALVPGPAREVITSNGPSALPDYAPQASGGGGASAPPYPTTVGWGASFTASPGYYQGMPFYIPKGTKIAAIVVYVVTDNPSTKFTAALYDDDGNKAGALLKQSAVITGAVAGFQYLPLTSAYEATADQVIWPMVGVDASGYETVPPGSSRCVYYSRSGTPEDPAPSCTYTYGGSNAPVWISPNASAS